MFARLFAASKHDETPEKDVQNFGKGVGDMSKVHAICEVSAICACWDVAETCDNRDMGTDALCPSSALTELAGAGRAPDRDSDTFKRGRRSSPGC